MDKETKELLDNMCAEAEIRKRLPVGALQSSDSTFRVVKRRDEVISHAWNYHKVPIAYLAAYFGKTKQGIYAALHRRQEDEANEDILTPVDFGDPIPSEHPEDKAEGRIYKHKNQGYED